MVMEVSEFTFQLPAGRSVLPIRTVVAPVKPEPVMVSAPPPPSGPLVLLSPVTRGLFRLFTCRMVPKLQAPDSTWS